LQVSPRIHADVPGVSPTFTQRCISFHAAARHNNATRPEVSMKQFSLIAVLCAAVALPLAAQTSDHSTHTPTTGEVPASTAAFEAASDKMHGDMAFEYSGNADIDFIRGMIPHHQGAVDAARIVLEHGQDPEVRKFAENVIAAQEAEIAWMTEWLAKAEQ
jgi:uncharacterized protein (DUF305 family)